MNNYKIFFILMVPFLFTSYFLSAQIKTDCEKSTPKSDKNYQKAKDLLKNKNFNDAIKILQETIDEDPNNVKTLFLLADIEQYQQSREPALRHYQQILYVCPDYHPDIYYEVGMLMYSLGKYDSVSEYFDIYVEKPGIDAKKQRVADSLILRCEMLGEIFLHPVPFHPVPLEIDSKDDDYLPMISPDNEWFYFTRRFKVKTKSAWNEEEVEEFSVSKIIDGKFSKQEKLTNPFNSGSNEGGASLTIDNKAMYLTVCNRADGIGSCDIYKTELDDNVWSPLQNLGRGVNSKMWDSQASISSDGKTLYYSSYRDSANGLDIYKVEKDENGNWSNPINLGEPINTTDDEKSPFIHTDNQTLYFSSNGHMGVGGFDIYVAKKDANGKWYPPQNIGYPINSEDDDLGFFASLDGKKGFFSSNTLKNGVGGWDIYTFDLPQNVKPDKVLFLRGEVRDENGEIIADAKVELKDLTTNKTVKIPLDGKTGKYVYAQAVKSDYNLTIQKEGYFYQSEIFKKNDSASFGTPKTIDVKLGQVKVGASFIVRNILFPTDSYELPETSKSELNNFVIFLQQNPTIKVSINGHTDNVGKDDKNLVLSRNRAKAVLNFVVSKGINAGRLSSDGFGKDKPIADNRIEKGRALNRRTEVVILEK